MSLKNKHCVPCQVGADPLSSELIQAYLKDLNDWKIVDQKKLEKTFRLKDFKSGLDLVNQIGRLAEEEGHHPDLFLSWGKVVVHLMTHKIDGLHDNDFILAAKIDDLEITS